MWSLLGIPVVIIGLVLRFNPVLVVTVAAIAAGLGGHMDPVTMIATLGKGFNNSRSVSVVFIVLPVIGLMERAGLQARARALVARLKAASVGGLLTAYFAVRQVSAALGLVSLGGHAQMVRPLIAPMAEAADEARHGPADPARQNLIRAHAAGVDNLGAFFGEDIFLAMSSVLLIQSTLAANHIIVKPLNISLWAIPTAVLAFIIHAVRLRMLDRRLARVTGPRA
jgi:uncharacterized membrane protein